MCFKIKERRLKFWSNYKQTNHKGNPKQMKFKSLEGQLVFVFHLLYRETSLSFLQQSKGVIGHTQKKYYFRIFSTLARQLLFVEILVFWYERTAASNVISSFIWSSQVTARIKSVANLHNGVKLGLVLHSLLGHWHISQKRCTKEVTPVVQ